MEAFHKFNSRDDELIKDRMKENDVAGVRFKDEARPTEVKGQINGWTKQLGH